MPNAVYHLEPGDKATAVTLYTAQSVLRGDLVTREMVRVSTWLRTPGLPEYAGLYNVTMARASGAGEAQVLELDEYHQPVPHIIALHLTPPKEEPVEHDPMEQNRKMVPVSAIGGPFRIDALMRMPQHMTLTKQMTLLRDPFISLYDANVVSTLEAGRETKVSMIVLRPGAFGFSPR
jgi:hypothetical protein